MKTSRFNESQIIKAIKEHQGGRKAEDIVRDLGISQGAFYMRQQHYGGMEASDGISLKDLELENRRLKRLLADTILDKEILKDVIEKKAGARRVAGTCHTDLLHFGISLRRALDLIGLSSFMFYCRRKRGDLEALALIRSYADELPAHGQDMMAKVFHRSHGWNHKKTEQLYAKLKLAKTRKKRLRRLVQPEELFL